MNLLDKLVAKQGAMSDGEFAILLKVPRSTWQLTRTGKVPLGPRVAKAARWAFPDLATDCNIFLLSDASLLSNAASSITNQEAIP